MGIPTGNPFDKNKGKERDTFFDIDNMFGEDDEIRKLEEAKKNVNFEKDYSFGEDATTQAIEKSYKEIKSKYLSGGVKSSRFITSDILINAPEDYFDAFDEYLEEASSWVRNKISDENKSQIISAAQRDPTDDSLQDDAYKEVQKAIFEYQERMPNFKGIQRYIMNSLITNEIIGFGKIDPLWRDNKITEILCNGPKDIQVEIKGQLKKVVSCKFVNADQLMALINRLYGAINKEVARMSPIVAGRLHDNSRMHAIHTSVAPDGPIFSIRRHSSKVWTPRKIIDLGTASEEMMTDLGNWINKGCSFLVIGGTSTGKTTMLDALSGFYRNDVRILTMEDNLELQLNPKKLLAPPMEVLTPRSDAPGSGVSMRDLVKASLRLRPDGIIVGEVRGAEAYDMVNALNTGHFGASTLHANSEFDGMYRLMSLVSQGETITGADALPLIAAAFDIVILLEHYPIDGSRKIVSISEVAPFPKKAEDGQSFLPTEQLWKFIDDGVENDVITGHWEKIKDISDFRTKRRHLKMSPDLTWKELDQLSSDDKSIDKIKESDNK